MRKRIHLKKKIVMKRKTNIVILSFVLLLISVIVTLYVISVRISPGVMEYAEIQAKKFVTLLINSAVTESIGEDLEADSLFLMTKDESGEVRSIDLDPVRVNRLLSNTTNSIQVNFQHIEKGEVEKLNLMDDVLKDYDPKDLKKGIIANIPTGVVFNNSLLANLGPKFPIRLKIMGDVITNVKTKVTNYGINNAVIEVSIQIDITTQAILPFSSKVIKVSSDVPLTVKLMQGNVPTYYFGNKISS